MTDQMLGADTVKLREFANLQARSAANLRQLASSLTFTLTTVRWRGLDAESFRHRWATVHSPGLQAVADSLDSVAKELEGQASAQERSSAVDARIDSAKLASGQVSPSVLDIGLVVRHPSLLKVLNPQEVQAWWKTLSSADRHRFIVEQSMVAGNTNGISFQDRVAANRINAENELHRLRLPKSPKQKFDPSQLVAGADIGAQDADDGDPAKISYLEAVASGKIRLAAYDPAHHSIIEMIGRLSAKTSHIITYVPGTFTNDSAFFEHQVQAVPTHLLKNDADRNDVAFVYKGGEFPDGSVPDGLLEARGDHFLTMNAPKLAAFQAAVDAENVGIGAKTTNISHSWGARLTSGSEAAGAHYDQVIALSGAALDPRWKAQAGTEYISLSYPDPLQTAEQLGVVGINYPMKDPHFEHHWYQPPTGTAWGAPFNVGNHNLIVSTSDDNSQVLRELQSRLQDEQLRAAA
ncbi:hypothetical protein [Psychromicrobium lacuslunae]|uniref:WXG100 family type VII secretion target n=1 Tax=Psychromicrobium lacuslunae TaxID=1618207 RepID=A0A0D4BZW9_9MICC|nr:hypothetical protein [Psychromicrobium lacuslunae]AJT41864.1 hypothetical protein UM93_10690 [Psychromicrobium lacuslunae]